MTTMGEYGAYAPLERGTLQRNWGWELARGVAAVVFGVLCFVWPVASLWALVLLWGVYAILDGIAAIAWGGAAKWWSMVIVGVLSIISGLVAFAWPGLTAVVLLYVIAFWAILRGATEIVAAVRLRKVIEHEWLLALGGVVTVVLGLCLIAFPGIGLLSLVWTVGIFAVLFGIATIALSLRVKNTSRMMTA